MKWMLVVLVLGSIPVETGMRFDTLAECLVAEDAMRVQYAEAYETWLTWAEDNQSEAGYPESREFMQRRIGIENYGACIPRSEPSE